MLNFLKQNHTIETIALSNPPTIADFPYFSFNFDVFSKGIDNVHIDIRLSPAFVRLCHRTTQDLLIERTTRKRRFSDRVSQVISARLEALAASYAAMLTAVIHRSKEQQTTDIIQLFEVALMKYILNTVQAKIEQLLYELRKTCSKGNHKSFNLYERFTWIKNNQEQLYYQLTSEILAQLRWTQKGPVGQLRQSLLGLSSIVPETMLFNPLLHTLNLDNHLVLMKHYVLLAQDPDSDFGFERLGKVIDEILAEIIQACSLSTPAIQEQTPSLTDIYFSWKDNPENIDLLFNQAATQELLEEQPGNKVVIEKLKFQKITYQWLEQRLRQKKLLYPILAAYETPKLYEHYAKLLKPYLIYQALCDEVDIKEVNLKLQTQLKNRPLRRPGDKPVYIKELIKVKKQLYQRLRTLDTVTLYRFIRDFVCYRRDRKYVHLMHEAMNSLHILERDTDIQLSQANNLLYAFFEQDEYTQNTDTIRCHVIIKADLRGSTTMTDELCRRGLNPATHFSRNFFDPIRQLLADFGAEKVFVEGDAVILSLFEYQNRPEHWLTVARACGLAQSMLTVVQTQNQLSRRYRLPELELGIGICYCSEAPKFLYDGEQRIMISPAIGHADRLSSCSWKLRQYYSQQKNLLKHVMVFQQSAQDAFKGEKGMTTFRYNLNGIELEATAFKKLQKEVALRQFQMTLPAEQYSSRFYWGQYPDVNGEIHDLVIREGRVQLWQEGSDYHPPSDSFYYEVVVEKAILNTIKRAI